MSSQLIDFRNTFVGKIEIDSLKIRIPLENVNVINHNLHANYLVINEATGEQIEEFKNTSLKFSNNGVSTRFLIGKHPIDSIGNTKEYLYILLNSKLLKSKDYFQGICNDNSKQVYNELLSYGVVSFSYDNFLKSECTDIDFKVDQIINIDSFKDLIDYLKKQTKESNQASKGYRIKSEKMNKGIQWSERENTSFATNPFIKIYHKELELKSKSKEFRTHFLLDCNISDIVRTEFTIKNKKHMNYLNIQGNTLQDLLNLTQEKKTEMLQKTMSSHIYTQKKFIPKDTEKMSPNDLVLYMLIMSLMEHGNTYEKIKNMVLSGFEKNQSTAKHRKKTELDRIYQSYIQGSKKDTTTIQVSNFLQTLGID